METNQPAANESTTATGPEKSTAQKSKVEKLLALLDRPSILFLLSLVFATLLAPFVLSRIQQNQQKYDEITKKQFEVVERINRLSQTYNTAVGLLVFDLTDYKTDKAILAKHLRQYDDVAQETKREFAFEVWRARFYFNDPNVHKELNWLTSSIAGDPKRSVDTQIIQQLNSQRYKYDSSDAVKEKWDNIYNELNTNTSKLRESLEKIVPKD